MARPYYGELCGCDRCKCSSDSCADDEDEGDGSCKCRDGYRDLVLKFETEELVKTLMLKNVAGQTIPLIITGNLREEKGGAPFSGEDCVKILKKKEKPGEDEQEKPEKDMGQKPKK